MAFFRKHSAPLLEANYPLACDIHAHLLPNIDDGSQDIETSLLMSEGMLKLGIKTAIATPHISLGSWPNTSAQIENALYILKNKLEHDNIPLNIRAAAEYKMDSLFFDRLESDDALRTIKDNFLLTEFSFSMPPFNEAEMARKILLKNYLPILAHPERYMYFQQDFKIYHKLAEMGFLLQLNLLSLVGQYGKSAQKSAEYMLNNNLISFVGTDAHTTAHLSSFLLPEHHDAILAALGDRMWNEALL